MFVGDHFSKNRVRLRPVEPADLPRYVDWMMDPEVLRFLLMRFPLSHLEEQRWYEALHDARRKVFAVDVELEGWRHVGGCSLEDINTVDGCAMVGIFLGARPVGTGDRQRSDAPPARGGLR